MEYKFDTKFGVGEIAYTLIDKKIAEVKIEAIEANITIIKKSIFLVRTKYSSILNNYTHRDLGHIHEDDLYKTKEELINNL